MTHGTTSKSMTHNTFLFHPLLLLAALFVLPAYSTTRHDEPEAAYRVYHLFDPGDVAQLQRATAIRETTRQWRVVEWVGIRRTAAAQLPFATIALDDALANVDRLPDSVVGWLQHAGATDSVADQVLVENTSTRRLFVGTAADVRDLATVASLERRIRTDVAVTTWGKVKELFR